ncbi:hypothetical protein PAXRUDRAFT_381108 [Paxillus rubicundulus Ve08.2h10]|uniref:CCHC-type domain-containing protein n=1 Tax=Paxillus rubicundulus Ve08.2h10 TaxID=930991 RepID=A0A0D0E5M6_9AGAM|nr:hypothetical protein PAXRUDRAFT_381108 [Paxillus rubicundulus Ve08.2h10]
MPEIIDLTMPSPHSEPIEISSDEGNPPLDQQNPAQEKKRRKNKKRKKSKGLASDAVDSPAQLSRDQSRERGNSCDTSRSPAPRPRSATPRPQTSAPTTDEPGLFYFDAVAAPIDLEDHLPEPQTAESNGASSRLSLPSHVAVVSSNGDRVVPVEIIVPPTTTLDDDDYIEYLDYDDGKAQGLVRYFAAPGEESGQSKPSIFKCKNCGAEGNHKTYECPVQICLTCGARDEHSTRNCPISKTCYTCGMKGHINKTCPNRFSRSKPASDAYDDCDRCGSMVHKMNECPTLWRIYQYANDEERILIKQSREEKRKFAIGEGGEGYIGTEEWCYNCASAGHLGDDCDELPHLLNSPRESSAFSAHNVMSGPFYDPSIEPARIRRGPRELQNEADLPHLPDDWGAGAPVNVGKQAKNKDREKLEKRFREQEEDEGEHEVQLVKRRGSPVSTTATTAISWSWTSQLACADWGT